MADIGGAVYNGGRQGGELFPTPRDTIFNTPSLVFSEPVHASVILQSGNTAVGHWMDRRGS